MVNITPQESAFQLWLRFHGGGKHAALWDKWIGVDCDSCAEWVAATHPDVYQEFLSEEAANAGG